MTQFFLVEYSLARGGPDLSYTNIFTYFRRKRGKNATDDNSQLHIVPGTTASEGGQPETRPARHRAQPDRW
jgi:hypothetical protein